VTRLSLREYAAVQREREPVRNLVGSRVRFSRRVVQASGLSASDIRLILGAGRRFDAKLDDFATGWRHGRSQQERAQVEPPPDGDQATR
jgi:hypothetical protein